MKEHLLLVDSDRRSISLFTKAFTPADSPCKCTLAKDIDHARRMLEYISSDIIFINLDPDICNSLQFVLSLKRQQKYKHVKVIAFCEQMNFYISVSSAHGVDKHISPPRTEEEIFAALNYPEPRHIDPLKWNRGRDYLIH